MSIEHPIQASCLILITIYTIRDLLRCVAEEVIRLTLHGPNTGILKQEPIVHLVALARAGRVADFVLDVVILLDEVLHYGAGFEEADCAAIGEGVGEGGDAAVGVDTEEEGLFLGVLG